MAWYGDLRFKQWDVIEFLVAEKGCSSPPTIQYNTDLAHSNCHLFGALKDDIRDDEVIEEAKKWLRVQNSNWCKKGTDALVSCW
jgi:hypothetical protein